MVGQFLHYHKLFINVRLYITTTKTIKYPPEKFINLCSTGQINEAFRTCNTYIYADPSLYSYLIKSSIQINSLSLVHQLHSLIIISGCSSTRFLTNHLLNAYFKLGRLESALMLFDVMPKKNIMSCNILIGGFVQCGQLDKAVKVFDEMPDRNLETWNAMIAGLTDFECNEEALKRFSEMHGLGFLPDEFTLGSVLRGCAGLKSLTAGQQVQAYVVKSGVEINVIVGSSLSNMYIKSGSLVQGVKVIKSMPVHSVAVYNTLIAGRAQTGCNEEALNLYYLMKLSGFRPDKITFVTVLSSCSQLATRGQGQQIHAEAIKSGATSSLSVLSSLVSMYSKCGCLKDSLKAFFETKIPDVVVWSSMISAYGFHGMGKEAIELFNQMEIEKLEANDITFVNLLYACSHCGLKDEGIKIFNLMTDKYKLQPQLKHYTCLVDLLGRSGRLEEAESVIRSMPVNVKADSIIWKTLLSACRLHKNADVAKRIAEEVIRMNPHDSASYVLLSNVQASAKQWHHVSDFRKAMRDMRVKKEPGVSWFEMKNEVHQFCMNDKSHPDYENIVLYLKKLMEELKLSGYKPDYGSILHDMDVEEKEDDLAHHSEKLDIAFALMNTPDGFPIIIMKNLRVCNDCHVAIKYISALKNREIIVRDTSRFHHFKQGQCSCRDYW
ncbi:pentatricopeptide repeat-containing protein At2g41080-like [Rutidosis leptorrhynchoides]|uniref:pentatricopeptide repeat-containing protein At2g41080-like n=1 Tax=Rutidosis leptorrhynchoides TaxID=125765 RepID=UPI003A997B57